MAKTEAQFIEAVSKYKSIAIYIPGSPDPDAIASAYALKLILKKLFIDSDIFAEKRLSLLQNQAFISRLHIPILFGKDINLNKYQAYIVPDFQSNKVEFIGEQIPCAAHIDHHGKSKNTVKADFSLIRTDAGSTSTLVALMIKNLSLEFSEQDMISMATALAFGIQTDTDRYNKIKSLDIEALDFLSDFADVSILQGINSMPLSPETVHYYNMAKENEQVYKDWAFYGIGFIDAKNRDSIAITADMLLKNSAHNVVAVYAIIENHKKRETYLDVSLRSASSAIDFNKIIKKITPNGGGRKYKGAYQIKLNYLQSTPDSDLLWQVVEAATLETLRRSRDTLYITGIKNIYENVKSRMLSVLKKD